MDFGLVSLDVDVERVSAAEFLLGLLMMLMGRPVVCLLQMRAIFEPRPNLPLARRTPHQAGEHPTEHVGDVVVLHALAVVLDGDAEEGLLCVAPSSLAPLLAPFLPLPDAASAALPPAWRALLAPGAWCAPSPSRNRRRACRRDGRGP